MLFDIGCNLLEAFDMIYERTGEENPNAIFEASKTNTNEAQPKFSATDISELFTPATEEGKANRVKLAKLVYGDGNSFTIQASSTVPWTAVFNKNGDTVVSFDEETKTVTINAKRAAYKKKVADFLAKGLKNKEYTNIDKAHKNTFQDAINQMEGYVKKALKGDDVSISALDKAVQDRSENLKAARAKKKQEASQQTEETNSNAPAPAEQSQGSQDELGQGVPQDQHNIQSQPQQQQQPSQNQQSSGTNAPAGTEPPNTQAQPNNNQPKTSKDMYKEFVTKFKEEFADQIPAECDNPNMSQSDIADKATEYFNEIQSPILDKADENTRNTAYRYVQAAINQHVRSLNGNNVQQNQNVTHDNGNANDDNFIWGETEDDGDLDGKNKESSDQSESNGQEEDEYEFIEHTDDNGRKFYTRRHKTPPKKQGRLRRAIGELGNMADRAIKTADVYRKNLNF